MTDDRTALIERVEKQADGNLVREMLAFAADRIMEVEVEVWPSAAEGARSPLREVHPKSDVRFPTVWPPDQAWTSQKVGAPTPTGGTLLKRETGRWSRSRRAGLGMVSWPGRKTRFGSASARSVTSPR